MNITLSYNPTSQTTYQDINKNLGSLDINMEKT